MELNSSVNTFIGGMNLDADISLLKENQYTYAENIRLLANDDSTTGILQNRDCLKKIESSITGTILGTVVTRIFVEAKNKSEEVIVVMTLDEIDVLPDDETDPSTPVPEPAPEVPPTARALSPAKKYINHLYIVYPDSENKTVKLLTCELGYTSRVKIVANYESDTVSKIYVSDGIHPISVIDITKTYTDVKNTDFELIPIANMGKPELIKIISGQLRVGAVQYAYQLFSKHGSETPMSVVSEIINIPKVSAESSKDAYGGNDGEISNIGVQIKTEFSEIGNLNMFRLFRIRYSSNNAIPEIFIVTEFEIDDNSVIYSDMFDSFISKITVDEFNMLTLTEFIPATIEKHGNYLFVADIKETVWDIEYDARAYRCDKYGNIRLEHSDQTKTIEGTLSADGKINGIDVPEKHDCINPSNHILHGEGSDTYMYGFKNGEILPGGTGPNVSYEFCFTDVICSKESARYDAGTNTYFASDTLHLNNSYNIRGIKITDVDNNTLIRKSLEKSIITNYSDSYFSSNFLGYQRDEVYRFGIVFYNHKNQKSNVHWIGDIKIPNILFDGVNSNFNPFHLNGEVDAGNTIEEENEFPWLPDRINVELAAKAIGIHFTVNNIDTSLVKRFEIVRCARTETDRTIITQAAVSRICQFDTWQKNEWDFGDSDIRPLSFPYWGKFLSLGSDDGVEHINLIDNYFELISPEICVNKQGITDNLKNCNVCLTNLLTSKFYSSNIDEYTRIATRQFYIDTLENKNYARTSEDAGKVINSEQGLNVILGPKHTSEDGYGKNGNAILFKFYKTNEPSFENYESDDIKKEWKATPKIENAIIGNVLPIEWESKDSKQYAQPINDKNYINTSVGPKWVLNNHGRNAIININSSSLFSGCGNRNNDYGKLVIANIKQHGSMYGGDQYVNKLNSTYISCVQHQSDSFGDVCVFGGDTYLGVFDYTNTMFHQEVKDAEQDAENRLFVNTYIPMESGINMYLFNSKTYSKTVSNDSNSAQNLIQYEPFVSESYTQTTTLYEYNSAYSADNNAQLFVPNLLYTDDNPVFETRIISSELKTNNEIVDSWTKFKFANYLDVDNQYGPVTNLKSFNGKLFFWQDSAVGVASVNERSLIQDNNTNMLTLGTGGILVRYDYYSTMNGSCVPNDRSICNSVATLYWYDQSKREICAINNSVIELSKVKGVKSWSNKLDKRDALGWYDWKYNEVLFQHPADESSRSLVFNEQLNVFTSFYNYPAEFVAQLTDKLVTFDAEGNLYEHSVDENYENFDSRITYVINKLYPETKVFDNVWFDAALSKEEVLKQVVFKTKTQETNPIDYTNIENREDTYRFPINRDKHGVARMRGKYLICDYTFDCKNDGDFKIPYIKTTFRTSRV